MFITRQPNLALRRKKAEEESRAQALRDAQDMNALLVEERENLSQQVADLQAMVSATMEGEN